MDVTVFDPRPCALGEGPLWHPERQQLFWFDIVGCKMLTRDAKGLQEWRFDRHVSAAGWVDRDTLLVATQTDLITLNLETGAQTPLCPLEAENPVTRSNDGRADPWGGFWIGTMGINAEAGAGAIYRYYRGALRQLFADITISNAICFAPDASYAMFTDTVTGIVHRQPLDPETGWPNGAPRVFLDHGPDGPSPDGAVIDAQGIFWCAEWGSSRVRGYAPDGSVVADVLLPVSQPSCPAFGGADLSDLYVTTARIDLTPDALAQEPLAGQVLLAKGLGKGQREHRVIL
jgi:sugar lactone lactonase YvrE